MSYQIAWPVKPKRGASVSNRSRQQNKVRGSKASKVSSASRSIASKPNIVRRKIKLEEADVVIDNPSPTATTTTVEKREHLEMECIEEASFEVVESQEPMHLVEIIHEADFPHQFVVEGQVVEEVEGMTQLYFDDRVPVTDNLNDSTDEISLNLAREFYKKTFKRRRDTESVPLPCCHCNKTFKVRANLMRHIRMHNGERPYSCNICGYTFTQQANLQKHMLIHTGQRPFGCHYCEKRFTQRANLVKHIRTHTGVRPYKCPDCDKAFTQQTNLDKHHRIHTGIKPFVCGVCSKAFAQQNNLVKHLYTHESVKPFICQNCGKSYTQKTNLILHQKKCIKITVII